jgi:probable F420-dependent oxidoreductase
MEFGLAFPASKPLTSPSDIVRMAQEAERLGYVSLWTYERLLRPVAAIPQPGGGEPQMLPEFYREVYEPLETLSHVAASTDRIKLGTSVIDALLHPPVVLARRFATLDQFSHGRVIAGLGQGWMAQEFETANVPMRRMGAGFDEVIAALRACWGPDPVSYQGRFYRIAPSEINPKPVQRHLPILVGAMTPAGIRRAARIADGLNPVVMSAESLLGAAALFREAARDAGRDPAAVSVVARANVPLTGRPLGADRPFLGGSPEQIADDIASLRGKGIDHVFFANMASSGEIEEELDLIKGLRQAVDAGNS